MYITIKLTDQDKEAIATVLRDVQRKLDYRVTLDGLMQVWSAFVDMVEDGYADCLYIYIDELSRRETLEKIIKKLPPYLKEKILQSVEPIDNRFYKVTNQLDDNRCILENDYRTSKNWWWYRIPKKLKSNLKEDLNL